MAEHSSLEVRYKTTTASKADCQCPVNLDGRHRTVAELAPNPAQYLIGGLKFRLGERSRHPFYPLIARLC